MNRIRPRFPTRSLFRAAGLTFGIAVALMLVAVQLGRGPSSAPASDGAEPGGTSIPGQRLAAASSGLIGTAANSAPPSPGPPAGIRAATVAAGSSALARHRAAIHRSVYGTAPIGEVLRGLVEVSGGPEVQLILQALALRKAEALPLVKAGLRTGGLWDKVMLTKFLGHCPWRETQPELVSLVQSRDEPWLARQGAVGALAALGDRTAGAAITAVLREPGTPVGLQLAAIAATARIGYRDAIPVLRPFAQQEDPHVRLFAVRALAELGEPVDPAFIESALRSGDYVVRLEACEALGALAGPDFVDALQAAARDDVNEAVRDAAARALLVREIRGQSPAAKLPVLERALLGAGRPTALWIIRTLLHEGGSEGRARVESLCAQDTWLGERCRAHLILTAGQ